MASEDYYDSSEDGSDTAVADDPKDSSDKASSTGLLPKSVFMGKDVKVGETLSFKITQIHDDEVQVKCVYGDEEPKDEPEEEEDAEEPAEEEAAPVDPEPGEQPVADSGGGGLYE
jgi:hypothetical protein